LRTKTTKDDVITVNFPNTRIIFWENTSKTPDIVTLRLAFPDGNSYDYAVKTFKFLEHSIAELETMKMAILLPFYVLKLRKKVQTAKTSKKLQKLSTEMQQILDELTETAERSADAGVISKTDMWSIHEMINKMFAELYLQYPEFEEANKTVEKKLKYRWEEERREGETHGEEKKTLAVVKQMLNIGYSLEDIAKVLELPLNKVLELKEKLLDEKVS